MMKIVRNGGHFCLGFQWNAASWDSIHRVLDGLSSWLDSHTAHWNLPALPSDMPVRRRTAVVRALRTRVEQRGDAVAAMGFSGASHPLLTIDELEREVSWGLKNPWGSGITDVLGVRPALMIPRVADCVRPAAWKLYGDHGFRLIGVFPDAVSVPVGAGCLPCIRVMVSSCTPGSPEVQRLRRLIAAAPKVCLELDLSGLTDADPIYTLLGGPTGLFGGRAPVLSPLAQPDGDLPVRPSGQVQRLDWRPMSMAGLHAALAQTAAISRKKRKKNEEYDTLLVRMGSLVDESKSGAVTARDPRTQLRLVAHMLGDVALTGSGFDVRLQGGRFSGITRRGLELMPLRPARSFIQTRAGLWPYRTVSSFSFESDHGTGLREELRIDGREDSIVSIEYSFRDDSPLLSIALEIRYPDLPPGAVVDEYAPLALPLRMLKRGEAAVLEVAAPDGSTSTVTVSEETGSVFAPGAQHRIRRTDGGWVVLHFASPGESSWGLPSFSVVRNRGARILECNPFGSCTPQPGSSVSGRRSCFSLRIGLEDA
jgi:hypothetical protein